MKTILIFATALIFSISSNAQGYKVELNLEKGESYTQTMQSIATNAYTINKEKSNQDVTKTGKFKFTVTDIQDTIYFLDVVYLELTMKVPSANGTDEYSSEKKENVDFLSGLLSTVKNKPFSIKMTKTGRIIGIRNFRSLFSTITESIAPLPDAQKQQILTYITQSFGQNAFKDFLEMATTIYPSSPVKIGEKWSIQTNAGAGTDYPAIKNSIYELKEATDTYFSILGNSKIKEATKEATLQPNGKLLKYSINGTTLSEIKIDRKTGWINDVKINQTSNISSQLKTPEGETDYTVDKATKNTITFTR